jgi:hypothetical protein
MVARMRRSERIPVEIPVVWSRGGRAVSCLARDLNLHGLFLCTDEIVEPGSLMHLRVALPERTIEMFTTARFVGRTLSGQGVGVEIFIIDDDSRAAWIQYYQRLCAEHEAQPEAQPRRAAGAGLR